MFYSLHDPRSFIMKLIFLVILLAGVILAAGCISPAPTATTPMTTSVTPTAGVSPSVTATPAVPVVPDLLGSWIGTSTGYLDLSTYEVFNDTLVMNITGQDGYFFTGELSFPAVNSSMQTKEFAGVVGPDGKTIETIEYPGGFSDGVILSADEIELIFRDESNPSTITIDSLRRSAAAPGASFTPIEVMPELLGVWNGTFVGYQDKSGYQVFQSAITMEVTTQDGRLFAGQFSFVMNGTKTTKEFAGVLGLDGETIETIEVPDGFGDGVVVAPDEIELIFRDEVNPSTIAIDSFRRSSSALIPAETPAANLVGTWVGTTTGYLWNSSGYEAFDENITMNVTDQADRLFKGELTFVLNGAMVSKDFAGVFDREGKTFATIEYPDGFSDGMVITGDEIWFVFRDTSNPSRIAIDTLRRMA
jgi:hypothetical protein